MTKKVERELLELENHLKRKSGWKRGPLEHGYRCGITVLGACITRRNSANNGDMLLNEVGSALTALGHQIGHTAADE